MKIMATRKMRGSIAQMAEIQRQSKPRPRRLVMRMPRTTINWKKKPKTPLMLGMAISPTIKIGL